VLTKFLQGLNRRMNRHKLLIAKYSAPETIFIYQMGKVGSTTLEKSLPNAVHIHAFYSKNHSCPVRLQGLAKFGLKHFIYRAEQEVVDYLLRRAFKQRKNTKVITLVRQPMRRNISMFFHDLDAYLYAAHTNCLNSRNAPLPTRLQSKSILLDVFDCEFDHNYALNWFDIEFLPMTGIDVYKHPFDTEQGYGLITEHQLEILCLRTDKLSDNVDVLSEFIGKEVELFSANKADEKWYGEIYQQFVQAYTPSVALELKIKASKFVKHFFN